MSSTANLAMQNLFDMAMIGIGAAFVVMSMFFPPLTEPHADQDRNRGTRDGQPSPR